MSRLRSLPLSNSRAAHAQKKDSTASSRHIYQNKEVDEKERRPATTIPSIRKKDSMNNNTSMRGATSSSSSSMFNKLVRRRHVKTETFEGEMVENERDGFGTYTYKNTFFQYTGDWSHHKKHGYGLLLMADGGCYEGSFENGEITGEGVRRWTNGTTYSGMFVLGEMHGSGTHIVYNGEVYEGEFRDNARHGAGFLTLKNGDTYRGEFAKNRFDGEGEFTLRDGGSGYIERFIGTFCRGKPHGDDFEIRCTTGDGFCGKMSDGRFDHGRLVLTSENGMIFEGGFENNGPVFIPNTVLLCAYGSAADMVLAASVLSRMSVASPATMQQQSRSSARRDSRTSLRGATPLWNVVDTDGFRHFPPLEPYQQQLYGCMKVPKWIFVGMGGTAKDSSSKKKSVASVGGGGTESAMSTARSGTLPPIKTFEVVFELAVQSEKPKPTAAELVAAAHAAPSPVKGSKAAAVKEEPLTPRKLFHWQPCTTEVGRTFMLELIPSDAVVTQQAKKLSVSAAATALHVDDDKSCASSDEGSPTTTSATPRTQKRALLRTMGRVEEGGKLRFSFNYESIPMTPGIELCAASKAISTPFEFVIRDVTAPPKYIPGERAPWLSGGVSNQNHDEESPTTTPTKKDQGREGGEEMLWPVVVAIG